MRDETIIFSTKGLLPAAIFWGLFGALALRISYFVWLREEMSFLAFLAVSAGSFFLCCRVLRRFIRYWIAGIKFMYGKE